jgi:MoaA/NifB/PqqE/SkfB family radical SAM enzyme
MFSMFHIEVEPTNQCNTLCVHCPHDKISRPMGMMDWETYRAVIDRVSEYVGEARFAAAFTGMGEPLLNPLVYRFIQHISARAVTSLTTNASALTAVNAQRLVEAGLDRLVVSFNGDDPELYEAVMGGLDFLGAENYLKGALEICQGTRTQVWANISVILPTQERLAEIGRAHV